MIKSANTRREERFDLILDSLKAGTFKVKDIAEAAQVNRNQITKDLKDLQLMYPEIKHTGSFGTTSKWIWEESDKTRAEKSDRYPDHKNDEGYADPTASAAIKNVTDIYGDKKPGEVWSVMSSNNKIEQYLVITDFINCCSAMKVCDQYQDSLYNPAYCVIIDLQKKLFVDVRRIVSKPSKYFLQKDFEIKNYPAVEKKHIEVMDFNIPAKTVEVVKEVPVEVIKEVPVVKEIPVVKEVPVEKSVEPIDVALLRQKAEIYEKLTWKLVNGICGSEEVEA